MTARDHLIETTADLSHANLALYDDLIDVRSPSEFAEDHIPGAINLPVLSDSERAEVGTTYVQISRFEARRMGAAYVSANIARHLNSALASKPKSYRPLIYCWRGGMRSNSMATVLSAIGWRCCTIDGGYKSWRRHVVSALSEDGPLYPLVLIDGQTGTGKTRIIESLSNSGVQAIDLEGLAKHRGSVFGAMPDVAQPTQKSFESQLYDALSSCNLNLPILVEAESRSIGRRILPKRLSKSMQKAPRIEIKAPVHARARFLLESYAELTRSDAQLIQRIKELQPYHDRSAIGSWLALADRGEHCELTAALMTEHYDPLYDRQRRKRGDRPIHVIELEDFKADTLSRAAIEIADLLSGFGNGLRPTA